MNLVIRKRTIVACFLTIIFLIITSPNWFVYKPMPITFDVVGGGQMQYQY